MSLDEAIARSLALRGHIDAEGGFVTVSTIAERYGISKARAHEMTEQDGFPPPVWTQGRSSHWTAAAVDAWRDEPRSVGRPRAPRPKENHESDGLVGDVTNYVVVTRRDRLPIDRFITIEAAADYIVRHRTFATHTVMVQEANRVNASTPYRKLRAHEQRKLEERLYPTLFE